MITIKTLFIFISEKESKKVLQTKIINETLSETSTSSCEDNSNSNNNKEDSFTRKDSNGTKEADSTTGIVHKSAGILGDKTLCNEVMYIGIVDNKQNYPFFRVNHC